MSAATTAMPKLTSLKISWIAQVKPLPRAILERVNSPIKRFGVKKEDDKTDFG
jgi:hypothetical protein